jgi:hypothetical protein
MLSFFYCFYAFPISTWVGLRCSLSDSFGPIFSSLAGCADGMLLAATCPCNPTHQLPQTGRASMSVVEVDDPQLIILLHFMTPFMAIQPIFESPLARPASLQGSMASQLLIDLLRDRPGAHGMLLVSIEQDGESINSRF